ncbi:MAG: ABC transporter permease [Candidatus Synoicihabitans palmerolidicus]|nr:ABC transporter permease [Candidatus Synoicihabitans palmerolidicus]
MISERLRWMRTKFRRILRRGQQEAELDAKLQFHLDELTAQFIADGMTEHDARLAARREFGTGDTYHEEMRDTWRSPMLADAWRSLAFAFRSLARTPGFTLIAILTLGLGIGANTSMFNLVNGILIKPLPYAEPQELETIYRQTSQNPKGRVSALEFLEFQSATSTYDAVLGYASDNVSMAKPGTPAEFVEAIRVSANFFDVLGIQPYLGRSFHSEEETEGRHRVIVLSQRYWQTRFGGRADVIDQKVRINGEPHEIIGVLPNSFNDWRHLG